MRKTLNGMMSGWLAVLAGGVLQCALAQTAPPATQGASSASTPGHIADTPRPDELEPGVNTSDVGGPAAPQGNAQRRAQGNSQGNSQGSAQRDGRANGQGSAPRASAPDTGSNSASRSRINSKPAPAAASGNAASGPAPSARAAARSGAGAPASNTGSGKAQDRLELDETQITGNRELPKVLYIVPWKRSDLGDLVGKPVNSLIDEVLSPVDRDVFKRENRYYDALKPDESKQGAAGAPAGGPATGAAPAGAVPATGTGPAGGTAPAAGTGVPAGSKP